MMKSKPKSIPEQRLISIDSLIYTWVPFHIFRCRRCFAAFHSVSLRCVPNHLNPAVDSKRIYLNWFIISTHLNDHPRLFCSLLSPHSFPLVMLSLSSSHFKCACSFLLAHSSNGRLSLFCLNHPHRSVPLPFRIGWSIVSVHFPISPICVLISVFNRFSLNNFHFLNFEKW